MRHYPLYKIDEKCLRRLGQGVLKTYNLNKIIGLDTEKAIAKECEDLLALNEDCNAEHFAELRQRRAISDSVPDDDLYAQVVEADDGSLFIVSVCRNDDDETMFEVFSEHPLSEPLLAQLVRYISKVFCWCTPRYICIWPAPGSIPAKQLLSLAGSRAVDSLLAAQDPKLTVDELLCADIALQPFELDKDWPWYERDYTQFLMQHPEMATIVPISEKDDISEAIAAGLCSAAFYRGKPLGMIMAESSDELGFNGLLISDIFITGQFRGQGFASPMQRLYYQQHMQGFEFFFGYIHADNKPSYNNALKQGRELLRQEVYLPAHLFL